MEEYVLFSCDTKLCIPSLYIDPSIIDWFTKLVKDKNYSQFIKDVWNITIKNVDFSEMVVKLIQFKTKDEFRDREIYGELKAFLREILLETKFCMPWLPDKNLYCAKDDYKELVTELKIDGLWESVIEVSDYNSNWIGKKTLKLIKFKESIGKSYKPILNKPSYRMKYPLYISCAYPWHQSWNINYFKYDTDFLAIDICASEWKQANALQNFNIFDILSLDLALCDANDYLNSYIEQLFIKEFKYVNNLHNCKKFEHFDLERYLFGKKHDYVHIDMYLYFIYSYGELLKTFNWADRNISPSLENNIYFFTIVKSIFPNIDIQKNKYISLKSNKLPSDQTILDIQQSKFGNIILDISNYKYFTPDMLTKLLKIAQVTRIEINIDLLEKFNSIPQDGRLVHQKTIYLYSNTGGNVRNIENILKYLAKFNVQDSSALLFITINNCIIENYEIFKNLEMYSISFQNMDISLIDLRKFCSHQRNLKSLHFIDCIQFGDKHLIELLVHGHLKIKRLSIEGLHSVTINFYFMFAEHQLQSKQLIDFKIRGIFPVIILKSMEIFQNLTFVLNQRENKIDIRNDFNEIIDFYDLFYSSDINDHRDMYDFYT